MLRGGTWNNNTINLRCANRNNNTPTEANNIIGFRCVRGIREGAGREAGPLRADEASSFTGDDGDPVGSPPVTACFTQVKRRREGGRGWQRWGSLS